MINIYILIVVMVVIGIVVSNSRGTRAARRKNQNFIEGQLGKYRTKSTQKMHVPKASDLDA